MGAIVKINLLLRLNNADSHETDDRSIDVEITDDNVVSLGWQCDSRPTEEMFTKFLRALYDNPSGEVPNYDDTSLGVAYHEIYDNLSRYAFDKLGWFDVTVDVIGLTIDDEETKLAKFLEIGMIDNQPFALQLSREGFMYCYA